MNQNILATAGIFSTLGFEPAKTSSIPRMLRRISPNGGTAMRDALIQSITMMLELYRVLMQLGTAQNWNFVIVLVTDGDDGNSKSSLEEAAFLLGLLGHTIPENMLKIWFIGVDIERNSRAAQEMAYLVKISNGFADFQFASDGNIDRIFEKIRIGIGLIQQTQVVGIQIDEEAMIGIKQDHHVVLTTEKMNYCVLFNLDMSGSMAGSKWNKVCSCVENFIGYLGPTSLVGGLVFNDKVVLLEKSGIVSTKQGYQPPPSNNYSQNHTNQYQTQNQQNYTIPVRYEIGGVENSRSNCNFWIFFLGFLVFLAFIIFIGLNQV